MDKAVRKYLSGLGKVGGTRNTEAQTLARQRSVKIMNEKKAKKKDLK